MGVPPDDHPSRRSPSRLHTYDKRCWHVQTSHALENWDKCACLRLCKSCRYIHSYLCCPQGTGPAESQCKRAFVDCFVPWLKVTLLFLLWASFEFSAHFCLGSHLRMRPLPSYLKHLSSISICFILSCPPLLCRFASLSHHAYIPSVRWHTTF